MQPNKSQGISFFPDILQFVEEGICLVVDIDYIKYVIELLRIAI